MTIDMIPRDAAWCTSCRVPEMYGPCEHHLLGPDGQLLPYEGPDRYEPSDWVKSVIGGHYRAPRWDLPGFPVVEWVCDGYDPRTGFWMRDPSDNVQRDISERAIDRTWHRVREQERRKVS